MKISKSNFVRMTNKFKVAWENLDASTEEPRAYGANFARNFVPFDTRLIIIINTSSIPPFNITSSIPITLP